MDSAYTLAQISFLAAKTAPSVPADIHTVATGSRAIRTGMRMSEMLGLR